VASWFGGNVAISRSDDPSFVTFMLQKLDLRPIPFNEQNEVIEAAKKRDFLYSRLQKLRKFATLRLNSKDPEQVASAAIQASVEPDLSIETLKQYIKWCTVELKKAEDAKLRLFGAVFKYAWKQANKHARWRDGMEPEDLITISWDAVDHAIRKFDFNRGVKFLTYAGWWILQYQVRHVQGDGIVRQPAYRYSGDLMEEALQMDQIVSLDLQTKGMTNEAFIYRAGLTTSIDDDENSHNAWNRTQIQKLLSAAAFLTLKEYVALFTVESGELSLKEAGDLLGVTREKIRQLKSNAKEKIQKRMRRKYMRLLWMPEEQGICIEEKCGRSSQVWDGGGIFRCKHHYEDLIHRARIEKTDRKSVV
jgi:RNA polymerase sigma factor (sigma-70 family)